MKRYLIPLLVLPLLLIVLTGCAQGLSPASWPGITVDDQVAYVAAGSSVYAINVQTGEEVWQFPAKASASKMYYAAPVLTSDGQLILAGFDHILYSVNPKNVDASTKNPQENWEFKGARDRWIGAALVVDNTLYAPNADYKLYAINLDGTLKWAFPADQSIWGTPATDGKNVYFGTLGRKVYAVDAQTGAEVWKQPINGAVLGSPVLGADNVLYVAAFDGSLIAMNQLNGTVLWQESFESRLWDTPVLDGNVLYFGDYQGTLYAYNTQMRTKVMLAQHNSPILSTPLLRTDQLAFGTEAATLYVIGLDGHPIWQQTVAGKLYGSPAAAGDLILVAPLQGDYVLVALDATGAQRWAFKPGK